MSYGADRADTFRQVGDYVARILKGEKRGDLPVLQPTKFEFVLNMQAAPCRCPLHRLPASRLLLLRSGLERSDFVPWHEA